MAETGNYQLKQWESTDRIMREDFNADNAKVDQALGTVAEAVAKCGNCRIWTTTYTGTGTYGSDNANSVTFPAKPVFIVVLKGSAFGFFGPRSCAAITDQNTFALEHSWNGNTLSWYSGRAEWQLNSSGSVYTVVAFLAADI